MEKYSKICSKCKIEKFLEDFSNSSNGKMGKRSSCKVCAKAYNETRKEIEKEAAKQRRLKDPEKYKEKQRLADARYYAKNTEKALERSRRYKELNRERCNSRSLKYRWENIEDIREQQRAYSKANKEKRAAAVATRRALKKRAIPEWSKTEEAKAEIKLVYLQCKQKSKETGIIHHVDHIVPLSSDRVCGLHCLDNLQIIPASDNQKKNNREWPDMPDKEL